MVGLKIDPSKLGLRKALKEYEELALRYVWGTGEAGANSREVWRHVMERLDEVGRSISRASVIFHLNRMVDQGVLGFRDATGKGGHQRVYFAMLDERGYRKYLLRTAIESMRRDFPEETEEVLGEFAGASG